MLCLHASIKTLQGNSRMKLILFLFLLAFSSLGALAQKLQLSVFGGISNYQGDLQGKRLTLTGAKAAFGADISYDITDKLLIRAGAYHTTLAADDKKNSTAKGIEFRNLNFTSKILEGQLLLEYDLFNIYQKNFTPYLIAGVAMFHFDPYTFDKNGTKTYLQPLSTEGQGLAAYPESKTYKLTQLAIPFGFGIKYLLSDNLQLGLEAGLRKTFTDQLDVSTNYVDQIILLNAKGAKAVELAYRGDEVSNGPAYPAAGAQRGNAKEKDWYYMTGLRISYRFHPSNGSHTAKHNSCPSNVY